MKWKDVVCRPWKWIFSGIINGNSSFTPSIFAPIFAKASALWAKWRRVTLMPTFCNSPDTNLAAVRKKWNLWKCFTWMKKKGCSKEFYQKWLLNVANVVKKCLKWKNSPSSKLFFWKKNPCPPIICFFNQFLFLLVCNITEKKTTTTKWFSKLCFNTTSWLYI